MVDYSKSRNLTPQQAAEMAREIENRRNNSFWTGRSGRRNTAGFDALLQGLDPSTANQFGGAGAIRDAYNIANQLNPAPSQPGFAHLLADIGANIGEAFGGEPDPHRYFGPKAAPAGDDSARNQMFMQLLQHGARSQAAALKAAQDAKGTNVSSIPGLPDWINNLPSKEAGERRNKQLAILNWKAQQPGGLTPGEAQYGAGLMQEEAGLKFEDITGDDWNTIERTLTESNPLGNRFSPQFLEQVGDYGADKIVSTKEIPPTEGMIKRATFRGAAEASIAPLEELLNASDGLNNLQIAFDDKVLSNITPAGKAIGNYKLAVEGFVRAMSGAEVPEPELQRMSGYFVPRWSDTLEQAKFRLHLMKLFYESAEALDDRDPRTKPERVEAFLERVGAPSYITKEPGDEEAAAQREQEERTDELGRRLEAGENAGRPGYDEEGNLVIELDEEGLPDISPEAQERDRQEREDYANQPNEIGEDPAGLLQEMGGIWNELIGIDEAGGSERGPMTLPTPTGGVQYTSGNESQDQLDFVNREMARLLGEDAVQPNYPNYGPPSASGMPIGAPINAQPPGLPMQPNFEQQFWDDMVARGEAAGILAGEPEMQPAPGSALQEPVVGQPLPPLGPQIQQMLSGLEQPMAPVQDPTPPEWFRPHYPDAAPPGTGSARAPQGQVRRTPTGGVEYTSGNETPNQRRMIENALQSRGAPRKVGNYQAEPFEKLREEFGADNASYISLFFVAKARGLVPENMTLNEFINLMEEFGIQE